MREIVVKVVRVLAAYIVAPLVAAPALLGTASLLRGQSPITALVAPLTFHGILITIVAAAAVLIAGTTMLLITRASENASRLAVWVVVGGMLGSLIGLMYAEFGAFLVIACGASTGIACATVFRLIAGDPFQHVRPAFQG